MMYDKTEADEDHVFEALLTYNNKKVHSAHNMTPKEARKPSNDMKIKLNLSLITKHNRIYPEVSERDKVKTFRKKGVGEKERVNTWSQNLFTVERVLKTN